MMVPVNTSFRLVWIQVLNVTSTALEIPLLDLQGLGDSFIQARYRNISQTS